MAPRRQASNNIDHALPVSVAAHSLWRAFRKAFSRGKPVYIAITLTVAVCIAGVVIVASTREGIVPFLLHVLAGVIAVLFVTFALERPLSRHVQSLKRFDTVRFCRDICLADRNVRILDIWMKTVLFDGYYDLFRRSVIEAAHRGVRIEIIVVDPTAPCASERAEQLIKHSTEFNHKKAEDIVEMMKHGLDRLRNLQERIEQDLYDGNHESLPSPAMEIRICRTAPRLAMYRVDEVAYWSHFLKDRLTLDGLQYRTDDDSGPAAYLSQHFAELWADESTKVLEVSEPRSDA